MDGAQPRPKPVFTRAEILPTALAVLLLLSCLVLFAAWRRAFFYFFAWSLLVLPSGWICWVGFVLAAWGIAQFFWSLIRLHKMRTAQRMARIPLTRSRWYLLGISARAVLLVVSIQVIGITAAFYFLHFKAPRSDWQHAVHSLQKEWLTPRWGD